MKNILFQSKEVIYLIRIEASRSNCIASLSWSAVYGRQVRGI